MTIASELESVLLAAERTLPAPREACSVFSVEPFIATMISSRSLNSENLATLDVLRRKVEISRHLRAFYDCDLKHGHSSETVQPEFAAALCSIFLFVYSEAADLKCLNAALKMLDGILLNPSFHAEKRLREIANSLVEQVNLNNASS